MFRCHAAENMARNPMATSLESKARRTNEAPESSIDEGHLDLTVPECCKQVLEPPYYTWVYYNR